MKEYALYKGEEILSIGTVKEIASEMGITPNTVKLYGYPSHLKRQTGKNYRVLIPLED